MSAQIPDGLTPYHRTPSFTEVTVPEALLGEHCTKEGVWGQIVVEEGALTFCVTDKRRPLSRTLLTPDRAPGVVEPTILHHVEPQDHVRFHVIFLRSSSGD